MDINELLAFTKKNKASDLHLISNHPPTLRVHGEIIPLRVSALSSDEVLHMLYSIMTEKQRVEYEENLELDFAVHFGNEGRFRVNAFNTINGPAAVLRDIPTKIRTIEELRLPRILEKLSGLTKGLILVTGPTGSGKSTTLAALVHHINLNYSKHILTVEDPIEFVHKSYRSIVNQREVGTHTYSFAKALRSALREDPDVILVGEMRDLETISLALTAAETGHLVLGTLHTSSASKTIDRIIDVFPEGDKAMARTMLAGSVEAVITQLLIRTTEKNSRVAVHEVLIANSAVRNLIRDNKVPQIQSIMQVSSKVGMRVMKDSVYELLDQNIISGDEAKMALNLSSATPQEEDGHTSSGGGGF
jgi:twitching motility protein PilT